MSTLVPWRFGAALAGTVVIGYAACTLLWVAFTDLGIDFLNSLFHGLDFRRLAVEQGFRVGGAIVSAIVLGLWAFLMGALFAALRNWLSVDRTQH